MFDSLIGNLPTKQKIKRLIANRRVPNSLLFAGPEGVGKRQFALELAKYIVCAQPIDGEACEECSPCRRAVTFQFPPSDERDPHKKVIFSEHADVATVVPYGRNVLVDAIRDLEKEANFRPYEARSRVFIIDDAHKMNDSASNALLKTLEEPPATSHIFLVTSKPDALLPTIRSRVQTLRFGQVRAEEIERILLQSHEYSQEEARLIASTANGSVSYALTNDAEKFRELRDEAVEVLGAAVRYHNIADILKRSEKIGARTTADFEAFLDLLQNLIHRIWSSSVNASSVNEAPEIQELARNADTAQLSLWLEEIEKIRQTLGVNINKKIAVDALFVQMASGR
jgi:DNA polymerase III subunit delta'